MISLYIRFQDGTEMFRTVWRVDVDRDNHRMFIWDTSEQPEPQQIKNATVSVFIGSENRHTYGIQE